MFNFIYIHHSAIPQDGSKQFWKINEYHRQKWNFPSQMGNFGGYNYLCEQDGELRQYREEGEETAAQKGENKTALSICLVGDFEIDNITPQQDATLRGFLSDKTTKYGITKQQIKGHQESKFAQTLCPGKNLMSWVEAYRKPPILSLEAQIEAIKKAITELVALFQKLFGRK